MSILYRNDFENDTVGGAPTGFTNDGLATLDVSSAQAIGTKSMRLIEDTANLDGCYHILASVLDDTRTFMTWLYFPATNKYYNMQTRKGVIECANVRFWNDGKIKYVTDAGVQDSGYVYTTGWHFIQIIHQFSTNKYRAFYDYTDITGGLVNMENNQTEIDRIYFEVANGTLYVDEIQLGYPDGNPQTKQQDSILQPNLNVINQIAPMGPVGIIYTRGNNGF